MYGEKFWICNILGFQSGVRVQICGLWFRVLGFRVSGAEYQLYVRVYNNTVRGFEVCG